MHVPDSAVSPATSAVFGTAMMPVWYAAGRRLRSTLASRRVPLLALGAAFSFTLMMFNLPVPGGTTVHTTGAVLLAIVLGPWAALLAVTVTLVIQALFFADGGVLALGLDCFTMAFAMPFAGWAVYRLAAAGTRPESPRRAFAAGLGAWAGLNVAALITALALGVQPLLYRGADGHAFYFPFGLAVTLPAMLIPHLTVAGVAEGIFTVVALRSLQAARIPLADAPGAASTDTPAGRLEWVLAALGALIALTPLGLLASGSAWGEWSLAELARRAGYLPHALAAAEAKGGMGLHLLPDYLADRGPLAYLVAGLIGVAVVALLALVLGRVLARGGAAGAFLPGGEPRAERPAADAGSLPEWLRSPADSGAHDEASTRRGPARRRRDLAAKTLGDLAEGLRGLLVAERLARRDGLLQRLDPRVKTVSLVAFVVLACLQRELGPVLALLAVVALLAALSRVPARVLFGRVGLAVGLVVSTISLPAALNVVTPGTPLMVLWRTPLVAVTGPGLALVALFVLRAVAAAAFGTLLALTTPWGDLLHGLRTLRAPRLFVNVLGMTWRYFAVLLQAAAEMFTARRSRAVGPAPPGLERRFLGGAAAALFGRTLALAEEVHLAMLARGGAPVALGHGERAPAEPRTLRPLRLRAADGAWLGVMGALAIAIALWGRRG